MEKMRNDAGKRILDTLDSVGFSVFAAGWVHDRPTNAWRYFVSTPMMKSEGQAWIYERLLRVFRKLPLPAIISPLDIYVIDPSLEVSLFGPSMVGQQFRRGHETLRYDGTMGEGGGTLILDNIEIEGFQITNGFVWFYRRLADKARKHRFNRTQVFDANVRQLEAA